MSTQDDLCQTALNRESGGRLRIPNTFLVCPRQLEKCQTGVEGMAPRANRTIDRTKGLCRLANAILSGSGLAYGL